jgi:CubicO group peptidase (beta-lactamase class C family)
MKQIIIIILVLFTIHLSAQNLYFPPNNSNTWQTINTNDLNWCGDRLDSLQQFLADENTKAFIILKDGKIAVEWYFDGFTQDSLWYWASAGKALTATLVGIAQEENHLDINDLSSQYLNSWTNCTTAEEQQITIKNQLSMTTGLEDNVPNPDCTLDTCLNCLAAPNTRWSYHNAPYTLLENVIENATGLSFNAYLFTRLNLKIGATITYLPLGYNNVAFSKARSMARFGLLTLAKGNWNGTSVYADINYYNSMTNSSQTFNPAYGYLWWLNGKSDYMLPSVQFNFNGKLIPNAPDDMFAALGKNDQKIYVVPSENMVVIRMGNASGTSVFALSSFDNEIWTKINDLVCTSTNSIINKSNKLTIFPNPTNGIIYLKTEEKVDYIEVISAIGQIIKQENIIDNQLNINELNSDIYYLKVYYKNGTVSFEKVVKR